jgi:predicted class III extradiol MEMO1 family dioxygenase
MNDIDGFQQYLRETKNNICGRHIIAMILDTIALS